MDSRNKIKMQNQTLTNTYKNCAKTFKTLHIILYMYTQTNSCYTQFPTALLMSYSLEVA